MGEHKDADKNHACDYGCNVAIGTCADSATDDDHVCDYGCGMILEACSDVTTDDDHDCDVCGKENVTTHDYTAVVTKPTCLSEGYTTNTCNCGDSYVDNKVGALDHDYDEGKVTIAPTYTATGVKTYTCKNDANHTYTEAIPVLNIIELNLDAVNATVSGAGFTDTSLIALTVKAKNLTEMSAYGFDLVVGYSENVEFVKSEFVKGTPFSLGLVTEKDGLVHITVYAPNAGEHVQDIVLDGEQALVTLYFRVKTGNISGTETTANFAIKDAKYTADKADYTNIQLCEKTVKIQKFMDANGDGNVTLADIQIGNMILTGEMMDGDKYVTYDATLDTDKDGEITAFDLMQILLYMHEKLTYDQIAAQ